MGVSHYTEEYEEMRRQFYSTIWGWDSVVEPIDDLIDRLFSIMNDYGAVDWT